MRVRVDSFVVHALRQVDPVAADAHTEFEYAPAHAARHPRPKLEFGRGLSAEDEPDLVKRDLTGAIELWIEVGLPDEREVRKASGRARAVKVYTYGGRSAALWWGQNRAALARLENLTVIDIPESVTASVGSLAARNMRFDCTIQEGQLWLSHGEDTLHFEPRVCE